jgi:16S rRNA G1207 methylase RsmC
MTSRYDLTRIQVVLELGAGYGVAGLLLGHWWPGVTVSVQADARACPVSRV